jgi:hypothetical protein
VTIAPDYETIFYAALTAIYLRQLRERQAAVQHPDPAPLPQPAPQPAETEQE